jgi:phenylpropionate dioxygenase-like ring-hydroxylating dioxygenase large terminal subunit
MDDAPKAGTAGATRGPCRETEETAFAWPAEGVHRIPDWVYTSDTIYRREVDRIFHGPTWNFVGLTCEIPNHGDYRRAHVGETPVITVRGEDGAVHVVENRCAHRGTEFCRERRGNVTAFVCPYHQWQYDLQGNLRSVPFRRGLKNKGGMPADFRLEEHNLRQLRVAQRHGLIFASFCADVEPLEQYLGPEVVAEMDAVFAGRSIKVLGYLRQRWPANWKLYHENIRDPNHASLLHVFLSTFGLFRPDMVSMQYVSPCGRHAIGCSTRGKQQTNEATEQMSSFKANLRLKDERFLGYTKEDPSVWSAAIQSIWPNFAVQRQSNTLAVREIIPNGPHEFYMYWTLFGYADDSAEMTRHRMRQANLIGPGGLIGVDDSEVLDFVQHGLRKTVPKAAVIELGGDEMGTTDHLITEAAIRSLYVHYRQAMGL